MIACDPQSLATAAQCFNCIPPSQQMAVLLYVMCQVAQNGGGGGQSFTSGLITLNSNYFSAAHGLDAAPSNVRAVLVCVANDTASGALVGDECDAYGLNFQGSPGVSIGANATSCYLSVLDVGGGLTPGNEGGWSFNGGPHGGGMVDISSFNNFRLKFYASL